MNLHPNPLSALLQAARERLLGELQSEGCWVGRLSASALAGAVAAIALQLNGRSEAARQGLAWIAAHANTDGGWGDSPDSPSNFTTTLLCWCALSVGETGFATSLDAAEQWLRRRVDPDQPEAVIAAVFEDYGSDRTFAAPILTVCRLAGKLPDWSRVPPLPFELAVLPHRLYAWLRLPVVSYALPALIAIGLVRHRNAPSRCGPLRWLRDRVTARCLEKLAGMQPESGGYLEAVPLTAFVAMSLAAAGCTEHPVTRSCLRFLETSGRDDGSWPVDVNLSTWLTSLSVTALGDALPSEKRERVRRHLLDAQWKEEHPFTRAAPGGWGWTSTSGAVPDADDTPAALLALHRLGPDADETRRAAVEGVRWLLRLQNRDGGWPTFCKGWGRLPFDRSCPDLTAHALRALAAWRSLQEDGADRAARRALAYLRKQQRPDGSWLPLWFGNQHCVNGENPVYGTAKVLKALWSPEVQAHPALKEMRDRGTAWLLKAQHPDGGWGGGSGGPVSIEETALAISALTGSDFEQEMLDGIRCLADLTAGGTRFEPAPIGLYFARLWYSERLYPLIFTVEALECADARPDAASGCDTNAP